MPYPRHYLFGIGWCISPFSTITIRLSRMMEYYQEGQHDLQIVEIIKSIHLIIQLLRL